MCATSTNRLLLSAVTALALCGCGGFQRHAQEEISAGLVWRMVSPEKSELLWQGRVLASGDICLSFADMKVVGWTRARIGQRRARYESEFCFDLQSNRFSNSVSREDLEKCHAFFYAATVMGPYGQLGRAGFLEEVRRLGERLNVANETEKHLSDATGSKSLSNVRGF